jgi:cbb3-type cytochrome oxidase subunit 1
MRMLGGLLMVTGMLIMAWNTWKTWGLARGRIADIPIPTAVTA